MIHCFFIWKLIVKEHLLSSKTVNKFYAAAWGIILLTADTSATPLANKQLTEDVKGALETLKKVKNSLLNFQAIAQDHRSYAHLFASPKNQYFRSLDKTEKKEETSSFGLQDSDPGQNNKRISDLIKAFCDPKNVESIQNNGRNRYIIKTDNPKPGQNFRIEYAFQNKKWYKGPYDQVQVKLQENGYHSFHPILDENQKSEVIKAQKPTRSMSKEAKTEYQQLYKILMRL